MIIVEGADNTGKSTAIKTLLELDPELRLLHRDRFNPNRGETIGTSYLQVLDPADIGVDRVKHGHSVADRFFASECIYGHLFRGGCGMSPAEHLMIRAMLVSYDARVLWCDVSDDTLLASWEKREQLYDDPLVIAAEYRVQMPKIFEGFFQIRFDHSYQVQPSLQHLTTHLHRDDRHRLTESLSWWSTMPYGAGQLRSPRIVLVGEGPSPNATTRVPFAHGPAGDFLAWTIATVEQRLQRSLVRDIYYTNADKGYDSNSVLLRQELIQLNLPRHAVVIALGNEAAKLLDYVWPMYPQRDVVRRAELPHPQYWRRFHYARRAEYPKRLLRAISPSLDAPTLYRETR